MIIIPNGWRATVRATIEPSRISRVAWWPRAASAVTHQASPATAASPA